MARGVTMAKKAAGQARFDTAALVRREGPATFDRGTDYARRGKVEIVAVDASRVLANVQGTETYRVVLSGVGTAFDATCTCPAFADRGFCKHAVATALAVNDTSDGKLADIGAREKARRAYLLGLGVEALADMVLRRATEDKALCEEIDRAVLVSGGDEKAIVAHFVAAFGGALEKHANVDRWGDRDFSSDDALDRVLDGVESLIASRKGHAACRILAHILDESDEALNHDHEGEIVDLMARAAELHIAACKIARPDPIGLASEVFEREMRCQWDYLGAADEDYSEVLGTTGRAEFRRLAEAAYAAMPPPGRRAREAGSVSDYDRSRLRGILERMAKGKADIDAAIARRAADAQTAYDYYQLASYCRTHGRPEEALKWAEEGAWRCESNPDARLTELLADLLADAGRGAEALQSLWAEFARQPSESVFRRIRKLSKGETPQALLQQAENVLASARPARERWNSGPQVLLRIAVEENLFDDAWRLAPLDPFRSGTLRHLAQVTQATHPAQALAFWLAEIGSAIQTAAGQYGHVVEMIETAGAIRSALGQQADHAAYATRLMMQYKARRNFIKAMNAKGYRP